MENGMLPADHYLFRITVLKLRVIFFSENWAWILPQVSLFFCGLSGILYRITPRRCWVWVLPKFAGFTLWLWSTYTSCKAEKGKITTCLPPLCHRAESHSHGRVAQCHTRMGLTVSISPNERTQTPFLHNQSPSAELTQSENREGLQPWHRCLLYN